MSLLPRRRLVRLIATAVAIGVLFLISAWQNGAARKTIASQAGDPVEEVSQGVMIDEALSVDEIDDQQVPSDIQGNAAVETNATVLHVVDGDTLDADLEGVGKVRIRMLGVNTPETVDPRKAVECFGKDASAFSKSVLVIGSRIRLDADPQADERDKYGRLLRNVTLEDGTDFNAKLVSEGYAYAYTSFPLTPERKVTLIRLQREAKEAKRGLWNSNCAP